MSSCQSQGGPPFQPPIFQEHQEIQTGAPGITRSPRLDQKTGKGKQKMLDCELVPDPSSSVFEPNTYPGTSD